MITILTYISFTGIILFIILSGFFSGLETAFMSTEHLKIKRLKKTKPKLYNYLNSLFLNPEHFVATILVGNNICLVIISSLATWLFLQADFDNVSFWVSVIVTPVIILFAEMIPKSIGRTFQSGFLVYFSGMFRMLEFILKPLVLFMEFVPFRIIRIFNRKKRVNLSKDDIKILTEVLHSTGEIKRLEKEAIEDVLGFSKDKVKDVYVPLKKVIGIDYVDNLDDILRLAKKHGFTRYPVFKNRKVIGYINLFDLFYADFSSWHDLIRPILKVGINQRLDDIFVVLRTRKENIALALKGGKPYGIITMQDLMREIITSLAKK